jgi:hypothetical protein
VQKEVQAVNAKFCGKRNSTGERDTTEKRRKKKEENSPKAFDVVKAAISNDSLGAMDYKEGISDGFVVYGVEISRPNLG